MEAELNSEMAYCLTVLEHGQIREETMQILITRVY